MSFYNINRQLINDALNHGGLIVAANNRLATTLQEALDEAIVTQREIQQQVESSPQVLTLDAWVDQHWALLKISHQGTALQTEQEQSLWQSIIEEDHNSVLLQIQATATLAHRAHTTMRLWQRDIDPSFYAQPDTRKFAHWQTRYLERCKQGTLFDKTSRMEAVLEGFLAQELSRTPGIALIGFQTISPLAEACLAASTPALCHLSVPARTSTLKKIQLESLQQEIDCAAQWCATQLRSGANRIGVVIPDLQRIQARVRRSFGDIFAERASSSGSLPQEGRFNISASPRLIDCAMVAAAVTVLNLNRREIPSADFYPLLHSVFLFDNFSHYGQAATLERHLRDTERTTFQQAFLRNSITHYCAEVDDTLALAWSDALNRFDTLVNEHGLYAGKHLPSRWAELFTQQLNAVGWPGKRPLNSEEYQLHHKWHEALSDFVMFDAVLGEISMTRCLAQLQSYLANIPFQPEVKDAPVQILGKLEASALEFDCLWILGMNDQLWPEPSAPNPLLPVKLQRECKMPHASPEQELNFATKLFADYQHAAKQVVCSYAAREDDQPLRASFLLDDITATEIETLLDGEPQDPALDYLQRRSRTPVSWIKDDVAASVDSQTEVFTGGAGILKDYASCPFKAFARHRLGARKLKQGSSHLSQQQRGIILHRALEFLWRRLRDSSRLETFSTHRIHSLTHEAAEYALRPVARERPDLLTPNRLHLETRRVQALLSDWLDLERQRSPFKIYALEEAIEVEYAGLHFKLRIDRIDQLHDHSLAIIDYKSGNASLSQWQGERPDEPQLPLYLLNLKSNQPISSLAFAQVAVDRRGWVGIAEHEPAIPGTTPLTKTNYWRLPKDWEALQEHWQETLSNLARGFANGDARVAPKSTLSCRYCDYASICRIQEIRINQSGATGQPL